MISKQLFTSFQRFDNSLIFTHIMNKTFFTFVTTFLLVFSASAQIQIDFTAANDGGSYSTCEGFIIDSGGQGGPGYSNNENVTITICPTDALVDDLYVQFNLFSLDPVGGTADTMYVFDGDNAGAPLIGAYTGYELEGIVLEASGANASGCLTFQFISDATGTGRFTALVTCTAPCTPPIVQADVVGYPGDSIAVCLNEPLDFVDAGTASPSGFNIVSYEWIFQDGGTANTADATHAYTTPGYYKPRLIATDENGCVSMNSTGLRVYVAPLPTFEGFPGDTTICLGQFFEIDATPETYGNSWSGFPNSSTIADGCVDDNQVGQAQIHTLELGGYVGGATLTDINDLESVCIELEHSFMGDFVLQVQCATGQTVTLHQQGGGGTYLGEPNHADNVDCDDPSTIGVGYMYCFTPDATQTWVDAAPSFTTLPAGDYASIQSLDGLLGCPLNDVWTIIFTDNWAADDGVIFSFSINVNPNLLEDLIEFDLIIPEHQDSSYWSTTFPWSSLGDNGNNFSGTPDATGDYTIVYSVIDNFGCPADTSFVLTVSEPPLVTAIDDIIVCDQSGVAVVQLGANVNNNGFSNVSIEWTSPDNLSNPNIVNPNATVDTQETFTITVYPTGAPECASSDQMSVFVGTPSPFAFDADFFVCAGETEFLYYADSLALDSFSWVQNSIVLSNYYSANLGAGTYTASFVDSIGCEADTTFTIETQEKIILADYSLICNDTLYMGFNTGVNTGVWSVFGNQDVFFESNDLNTMVVYNGIGTVGLIYSEDVCDDADTTYVEFNKYPWTQVFDSLLCDGEIYEIYALNLAQNTNFLWNTGSTSSMIPVTQSGDYIVTVTNVCGSHSDTATVQFITCDLDVPNVFTPNGDDVNDYFQLVEHQGLVNFNVTILNRWGNLINEFNFADFKWDGTDQSGKDVVEGVYFYRITTETMNGKEIEKHGFVQVVRN